MLEAITEDQVIAMDRTRKSQYIALQKFRGQNPHEYLPDRICSTFFNEEEVGLKLLKQEEKKELERNIKRNLNKSFDYNPIVVDGSVLLQDVINGFYTMENIALAKNGHFDADGTAERSVLKLLDNVLTYSRKRTHDILQPHEDPRQFFKSLQQSGIDIENLRP